MAKWFTPGSAAAAAQEVSRALAMADCGQAQGPRAAPGSGPSASASLAAQALGGLRPASAAGTEGCSRGR
eukprot:1882223-Alexandrium_andersonii.AAC.1